MNTLANNLHRVHERIATAARRSGRDPSDITLVAVTKTHPAETIVEAYELGVRHFGENRVEEAAEKIPAVRARLPPDAVITWHMVGHVQSRKTEAVARLFDWVHSVDSLKLAERLSRFAEQQNKTLCVLLEFNVSGEASKYGLRVKGDGVTGDLDVLKQVEAIAVLPHLKVEGLMTMAPIVATPEQTRPVFRALRRWRDQLATRFPQCEWRYLSIGMTDDYEVAIEEGATIVRIGRAIFGERKAGGTD
ncbi:MAG: YggS family pyridoxal phosphate-dependent enzyme [Anaerolineae bacterium]